MVADKRDILIRLLGEETVVKMTDRAGGGLDRFGDKLEATERDAADLDRQIADVEGSLKTLATVFARTSDAADRMDITKAMRRQQAELRKLTKAKDLLPDFGKAGFFAANGFAASFIGRVGPLMAKMPVGPVGAAIGAAIAIPLVPTLAAAVSGAVVGGVGIGGVIGGVALAAKDSRVQAAGKQLGESMLGDLEDSATRFVQPTLAGITEIQSAWDDVAGDLDGAFAAASRYVKPLAEGVGDFVRELGPGLREAAEAAGPIVQVVKEELPELGAVLSDMFSTFAEDADEGAAALRFIFMALEDGIAVTSGTIHLFSEMYRALVHVADAGVTVAESMAGWLPFIGDQIGSAREKVDLMKADLEASGDAGGEAGEKTAGGLRKVDAAAASATVKVESLSDAIKRMAGENISAEQANMRLEEAIDRATEAGRKNNDGISVNTEKGRANRQALIGVAEAANTSAEAIFKQTNSQELASAATEKGRRNFLAAAAAMGVEKGEAKRLADQLFAIPTARKTTITTPGMGAAIDAAKRLKARIDAIDRRIDIKATLTTSYGGGAHTGQGYSTGMSEGGAVIGRGPKGVDSEARLLAPGEHVWTDEEVDAAGGHGAMERMRAAVRGGHSGRSVAVAGSSRPRSSTAVAAAPVLQINASGASGLERVFMAWLVKAIRDGGGNPNVLGLGGGWS